MKGVASTCTERAGRVNSVKLTIYGRSPRWQRNTVGGFLFFLQLSYKSPTFSGISGTFYILIQQTIKWHTLCVITKKKMGKEAMRFLLNQRSGSCQLFCKKRPFSWWVKWNPLQCRHFPFSFSFFTFHSRFSNSSCILVRSNPLRYRQSRFFFSFLSCIAA